MEINEIFTPSSPEIFHEILNSSEVQEKIGGCASIAFNHLHAMYTMKSRAAAYELIVGEAKYRVVVNFTDSNLPFAIKSIKVLE